MKMGRYPAHVAVNTRVLAASLAAAALVSVAGGYALSRTADPDTKASAEDSVTITSNGVYLEPGIPTNAVVQGKPLPDVELVNTDGTKVSTRDLIGTPLVINVWATTCVACKQEMPALAQVNSELGSAVRFVGVNQLENTPSALAFAKDKGVHYELLSDENGELIAALGITGLPYTLFVAADGTIVAQKGVELNAATIRSTIESTLLS
jgi:peroxiredoxin